MTTDLTGAADEGRTDAADEDDTPMWGKDGPTEGQIIELRDIPGVSLRWTNGHWEYPKDASTA